MDGDAVSAEINQADMIISQLKLDVIQTDNIYSSLKSMEQIQVLLKHNDKIIKDIKKSKTPLDTKFHDVEQNLRQIQTLYDNMLKQDT